MTILGAVLALVSRAETADATLSARPRNWFLPDIEVSYRDRDRRLVACRGLTNIRDARGKLLHARIDFPDSERRDAAPPHAGLLSEPLVTNCD